MHGRVKFHAFGSFMDGFFHEFMMECAWKLKDLRVKFMHCTYECSMDFI